MPVFQDVFLFMKVLMRQTNKIEEVNDNYALNFLIPNGKAVIASKEVLARKNIQDAKREADVKKRREMERKLADELRGNMILIKSKANEEGELYGSINKNQIKKALKMKGKVAIFLDEPIKHIGDWVVKLKVGDKRTSIVLRVEAL